MSAGVLLSVGALLIAGVSLLFTALERRARITELDLLRRQVEGAEQDRAGRKRAELMGAHGGISGGSPYDEHEFFVLNAGPAIARAVDIWARDQEGGDVTSKNRIAPALTEGERVQVRLAVLQKASREGSLTLWASWRDDTGDREEALLPLKRL
jgi:hypothetical protein